MIKIKFETDTVGDWMVKNNITVFLVEQLKEFKPQVIKDDGNGISEIIIPDLTHEVVDCGDVNEEGYQPSIIISKAK